MTESEHWSALVPELSVTDLEASLNFYRTVGFQVRFVRTSPPFAYLALGDAQIMLEQAHSEGWVVGPLERPFGRGINLQIEVDNVQSTRAALASVGLKVFREPADSWYQVSGAHEEGQRELLVQDPDGYLLRFVQPLGRRSIER
jgi:catechol 2,3-dioxygenase-like lactoylglutathione lyase family enzyme